MQTATACGNVYLWRNNEYCSLYGVQSYYSVYRNSCMAYRLVTNLVTVWTLAYFSRGKFFSTAYLTYFLLPCDKIWQRPLEQLQEEDFRGKWLTQFYLVYRSCVPVLCCTGHGRNRKHADISPHTVFWPTTDTAATSRVCEWISFCGIQRLPAWKQSRWAKDLTYLSRWYRCYTGNKNCTHKNTCTHDCRAHRNSVDTAEWKHHGSMFRLVIWLVDHKHEWW